MHPVCFQSVVESTRPDKMYSTLRPPRPHMVDAKQGPQKRLASSLGLLLIRASNMVVMTHASMEMGGFHTHM